MRFFAAALCATAALAASSAQAGDQAEDCAFLEDAFRGLNANLNRISANPNAAQLPAIGVFAELQRNLILMHGQRGCETGVLIDIIRESAPAEIDAAAAARPAIEDVPVEPIDKAMVVRTTANLRAGPSTDAPRVARVAANRVIPVIGKVKDKDWFKVRLGGGIEGYIFANLLADPKDVATKSFEETKQKAEAGDAQAQFQLGNFYVASDMFEAVSWWQAAAEQGVPVAQYNVGVAYIRGGVLPQDDAKAEEWWTKAAEGGHEGAKRALAGEADG